METIEITAEQRRALERGESITIQPEPQRTYIVVYDNFNVFRVTPPRGKVMPTGTRLNINTPHGWGECAELVAKGPHTKEIGFKQRTGGLALICTEVTP